MHFFLLCFKLLKTVHKRNWQKRGNMPHNDVDWITASMHLCHNPRRPGYFCAGNVKMGSWHTTDDLLYASRTITCWETSSQLWSDMTWHVRRWFHYMLTLRGASSWSAFSCLWGAPSQSPSYFGKMCMCCDKLSFTLTQQWCVTAVWDGQTWALNLLVGVA